MRKVIVLEQISLDGIIQAPGDPEEDTRGGFAYGTTPAAFNLIDSTATPSGVIVASYQRAGKIKTGTVDA